MVKVFVWHSTRANRIVRDVTFFTAKKRIYDASLENTDTQHLVAI